MTGTLFDPGAPGPRDRKPSNKLINLLRRFEQGDELAPSDLHKLWLAGLVRRRAGSDGRWVYEV